MSSSSSNSKTAFVLSGGASLGAVEVGALKAITEQGIQADLVLGTSVGSLNGAMYAYNPTLEGIKQLEEIWLNIKAWDVFTPSPVTPVLGITTAGQYLISPKNLRKLINKKMPFKNIEDTQIPLYIIGTDVKSGEEVVFDKGLAIEALMTSAGIPGVFPPQHMANRTLVDGGVVNNAAISTAYRLGAKQIVIFPIGTPSPDREPKNFTEMIIHSLIYLLNRQLTADILYFKDQVEMIVIPPPNNVDVWPNDFSQSKKLITKAYEKAKHWLDEEGFASNIDEINLPCNVYTKPINFMEAVTPDPPPKALERVKERVSETTKAINHTLAKRSKKIKKSLVEKKDDVKEKLLRKKSEEEK